MLDDIVSRAALPYSPTSEDVSRVKATGSAVMSDSITPSTIKEGNMLTEAEFATWYTRLALSSETVELVHKIRNSPPVRSVQQNHESIVGKYPSRKMGFTIQFESHTVEFPLVYKLEYDDDALEYYCQPSTFTLEYLSAGGRLQRPFHTPDYFVIRHAGAGWIEAKNKEKLQVLSKDQPNRYRLENGVWVCPPGIKYAQRLGLTYTVHSSAEVSSTFTRNATLLDDYLRNPPPVSPVARTAVENRLERSPIISLAELIDETAESASRDEIYTMIVQTDLHVDWDAHPFIEPEGVRIFASAETAANFAKASAKNRPPTGIFRVTVGDRFAWDGRPWSVANVGENLVSLRGEGKDFTELPIDTFHDLCGDGRILKSELPEGLPEHPEVAVRTRTAGPEEIAEANRRFREIEPYINRKGGDNAYPTDRTIRRWLAAYEEAKSLYGNGMLGLYPKTQNRGNRTPRLDDSIRQEMMDFICSQYETSTQQSRYAVWSLFKKECEDKGLRAPALNTFLAAIKNQSGHEQQEKRKGRRGAYTEKPFHWHLDHFTPRHGDRPFEIAHVDHTELDVELIHLKTGQNLGRPWLTIMTDAYSRKFLGIFLSFDPPSYRSCMMVIRDCVRRHGRMPQIIVTDGGREFKSIYYDQLLAKHECTKKLRPAADPRFGSTCERLFGTTNTQFIHNLAGNTKITKTVRIVTKSVNPKALALWDFSGLLEHLEVFLFEKYEIVSHPALSQPPRDAFNHGMATTGTRQHRRVAYDLSFIMSALPTTRKGTVRIRPGRGFVLEEFTYWNDSFHDPALSNKDIPVRYDPFDKGTAWVFVKGRWVECHSNFYAQMKGKTEKQIQIATEIEGKLRSSSAAARRAVRPRVIAEILSDAGQYEELNRQRLRDLEVQSAYGSRSPADRPSSTAKPLPTPKLGPQLVKADEKTSFEVYEAL